MDSVFFLDSAANVWETCSPNDNDAEAFGPRGAARRISESCYSVVEMASMEGGWQTVVIS